MFSELARYGFADPRTVDDQGVVAVGGPMDPQRLLAAYRMGIFPWCGDPVGWYSPNPRGVIWEPRLPKRIGKVLRREGLRITLDRAFVEVVRGCAEAHREDGLWITDQFVAAYATLHEQGHAHSVEVWQGDALVGGLYGVQVGGLFAGESMFYRLANASKVAFTALALHLRCIGVVLIDCQMVTAHTERLGAVWVYRHDYLRLLAAALRVPANSSGKRWVAQADARSL